MQLQNKQLITVGVVGLIFGLLFDYLFYGKLPGISFVIYVAFIGGGLLGLASYFKIKISQQAYWYFAPLLFFSGMVAVRNSGFLTFWNIVLTLGLLVVMSNEIMGRRLKSYVLWDYVRTGVVLPLTYLGKVFEYLGKLLSINKGVTNKEKVSQVIKGLIITIPILIFFSVLLSSADLVFSKFIGNIFNFRIAPQIAYHLWWILVFAVAVYGVYCHILENASAEPIPSSLPSENKYRFGRIEAGILFGVLNALFLIFVTIQIKYLFAGQAAITRLGFTYAEYAHKGFYELIFAALFTFALIFGTERYLEKKDAKNLNLFKLLSLLMMVFMLVIIASAFMRLSLYEQAYGFSFLRILAQSFIVWLAAVFLLLAYKTLASQKENLFLFSMLISVLGYFVFLNVFNPDAFIARENIKRFAKTNKLDTEHLERLSADAVPEIIKLLDMPALTDQQGISLPVAAAWILESKKNSLSASAGPKPWQSYNRSQDRAIELIIQREQQIKEKVQEWRAYFMPSWPDLGGQEVNNRD